MPVLKSSNKIIFRSQIAKNTTGFLLTLMVLRKNFLSKIRTVIKIIREIKRVEKGKIETDKNSRYLLTVTPGRLVRVEGDECEALI
jgi:ethanolamine utilization cobalamin adenosyltransferase